MAKAPGQAAVPTIEIGLVKGGLESVAAVS
jgi:hypothetical protein